MESPPPHPPPPPKKKKKKKNGPFKDKVENMLSVIWATLKALREASRPPLSFSRVSFVSGLEHKSRIAEACLPSALKQVRHFRLDMIIPAK